MGERFFFHSQPIFKSILGFCEREKWSCYVDLTKEIIQEIHLMAKEAAQRFKRAESDLIEILQQALTLGRRTRCHASYRIDPRGQPRSVYLSETPRGRSPAANGRGWIPCAGSSRSNARTYRPIPPGTSCCSWPTCRPTVSAGGWEVSVDALDMGDYRPRF